MTAAVIVVALLGAFGLGMLVDRALVARWMRTELDTLQAAMLRREQLEQQPDELARMMRSRKIGGTVPWSAEMPDRGDVDPIVVVITGLCVLAIVVVVQLGIRAGLL